MTTPSHPEFHTMSDLSDGIARTLTEGLSARIYPGDQAMLSVVTVEPGAQGSIHSHAEEQGGMCLEGSGTRIQGGIDVPVSKGDFWRTPGGVEHGFRAGPDGARLLDIFAPPRADYRQSGSGFGDAEA